MESKVRASPLFIVLLMLLLNACSTLPRDVSKQASYVNTQPQDTELGRLVLEASQAHDGKSGFSLLRTGRSAFTARMFAIQSAKKSLDLQYYIWNSDTTGMILASELIHAADRGVRVRLLLDDNNIQGRDKILSTMDRHNNIEIRLFNPFANRGSHLLDILTDFRRINHRMHNKMLVVDNVLAIVGGRNIGDHYFAVDPDTNFRDLDVVAAGPIVANVSKTFDEFWNSQYAMPAAAMNENDAGHDSEWLQLMLDRALEAKPYPYELAADLEELKDYFGDYKRLFVWGDAEVIYDRPESISGKNTEKGVEPIISQLMEQAQHRIYIESAYFVASDKAIESAGKLIARGVDLRVMTNSLASNDVIAAHAGYAEYRIGLLKKGVVIHELRPDSDDIRRVWRQRLGESKAGLHTKAVIIDYDKVFIGSYNLDPRSANINTEVALLINSPELNQQVEKYLKQGLALKNSYRVYLDENGKLKWLTLEKDGLKEYSKEPRTGFWQRLFSDVIEMLPVQSQL